MTPSEPTPTPTIRSGRLWVYSLVAVAIHVLVLILALQFPARFGYTTKHYLNSDIEIYHRFAVPVLAGQIPYRDYPVEYPILAMPLFLPPLLAGQSFERYRTGFLIEIMLIDLIITFVIARRTALRQGSARVPTVLAWYTAFFLALCPLIALRFDLFPTLLALLATLSMARGWMGRGGFLAGLGVLTKIVPGVVMVPLLAIPGPWKSRVRGLTTLMVTTLLGGFIWWWLSPDGFAWSLRYHSERGLEIGSLPASAYLLSSKVFHTLAFMHFDHACVNVGGPGSAKAAKLMPIVQGALLLLVAGKARSATLEDAPRLALAALLAFIIAGKVLSPQYMIWLVPFVAILEGPRARAAQWLFLACCILTTVLFPHQFESLGKMRRGPTAWLVLRNLGLIWLFVLMMGKSHLETPTLLHKTIRPIHGPHDNPS